MATFRRLGWLLFGVFLLLGSLLLVEEHLAHAFGALPYLLGVAALVVALLGDTRRSRSVKHAQGGR